MKTVVVENSAVCSAAAEALYSIVGDKPHAAILFSDDPEAAGSLRKFIDICAENGTEISGYKFFAASVLPGDKLVNRSAAVLEERGAGNIYCPSFDEPEKYDAVIAAAGGIDAAIISVGKNGRVIYNEPAVRFDSETHIQKLTDKTKKELAEGSDRDIIPENAVTAGIRTVTSARNIIVAAAGTEKADAVYKMLYARTDSVVPAAFLQLPLNVTVFADTAAAAQL